MPTVDHTDYEDLAIIKNIVEMCFGLAINLNQTTVTTEHVLWTILNIRFIKQYLKSQQIDVDKLSEEILNYLKDNSTFLRHQIDNSDPNYMMGQLTAEVTKLFELVKEKSFNEHRGTDIVDFFLVILSMQETYANYFLKKYSITEQIVLNLRKELQVNKSFNNATGDRTALAQYCVNLNEKAKSINFEPLIGRNQEIQSIAHTLSKRKKCNVLLVGDPGVGKSETIEGLAKRINEGNVPEPLKNKEIWSLDAGNLLAGSGLRGEFEEKIKLILNEISNDSNAILFLDEAQQIDSGEGKGQMGIGLSSMLKPKLSRGEIKVIAATTWEGYRQTFERDTALMRRFRILTVNEPTEDETINILKGSRKSTEEFHHVTIDDSAIKAAVELTVKYQPDKRLPDKAVDIIDSACARTKVENISNVITRDNIIREITDITGITIKSETTDSEAAKYVLTLADRLKNKVFHQDTAIDEVAKCIIISQAGLKQERKPIGSFLLVGPSGVGKTFLAKQLASEMNMKFIKYDMSEFQEKHTVSRLIGAPPGYVGFGDGKTGEGQLVNDIIKNPNSVILFDEVEKAHQDIFNVFLQLLDEGEITGTTGKVANARNCIFMMTSNLGTKESSKDNVGFIKDKSGKSASSKAVDNFFLTELRGRMSGIIEFSNLDELSYRKIVAERINDISNMIMSKNIRIIPSENLVSYILSMNNSKEYGARKLANIVEQIINYPLSIEILNGKIKNDSIIELDWKNNKLEIKQQQKNLVPVKEQIHKDE